VTFDGLDTPDALSVVFRAVSFALLLNAAGIPIFVAAFGKLSPGALPRTRRLGWQLAVGALVFVTGHHLLEAARMAGEMGGVLDPAMQGMTLWSKEGAAFAAQWVGAVLIAVGLARAPRTAAAAGGSLVSNATALTGAAVAILSFTLIGHTSINPHRPAAAALLTLHLLLVAFWLGALWPLYLSASGRLIDAFSRVAAWLIPLILVAGVALATLLVPDLSAFKQPYGQLLLAKVGSFAVLMALAALNKWRFGPACEAGDTRAFKRTVIVEYVLICVVLAITAVLTTFYSPAEP
jgi:putative copper export protein